MSISSSYLDAFYALAQTANFTRAAEQLHITQSAFSQRIANLEQELGTSLFIRERSGIRMTDAAEELLRYCQIKDGLENEVLENLRSSSKELSGVVRIAGFSSVMRSVILPALAPLLEKNPKIQLQFLTRELQELPMLLKSGEADFVVLNEKLERDELEAISLGDEENVLVEKKGYTGAEIFLDHDERDETTRLYFQKLRKKSDGLKRRYMDDVYGLLDGVSLGLGRAVLPKHLIKERKDLKVVNPSTSLKVPVTLHFYKHPYYSKLHDAVKSELIKASGRLLS